MQNTEILTAARPISAWGIDMKRAHAGRCLAGPHTQQSAGWGGWGHRGWGCCSELHHTTWWSSVALWCCSPQSDPWSLYSLPNLITLPPFLCIATALQSTRSTAVNRPYRMQEICDRDKWRRSNCKGGKIRKKIHPPNLC